MPGQFDQRADSALQCLKLIYNDIEEVTIVSGKVIVFDDSIGNIDDTVIEKIKKFYIENKKVLY